MHTETYKELIKYTNNMSASHVESLQKNNKDIIKYINDVSKQQDENHNKIINKIINVCDTATSDLTNGIGGVINSLVERVNEMNMKSINKLDIIKGWDETLAKSKEIIILAGPDTPISQDLKQYRKYNSIDDILEGRDEEYIEEEDKVED